MEVEVEGACEGGGGGGGDHNIDRMESTYSHESNSRSDLLALM